MKDKIVDIITVVSIFILIGGFITILNNNNGSNTKVEEQEQEQIQIQQQREREEAQREAEKIRKEKELETIEGWINQNENSNFDNENKIMYISNSFPRYFSLDKRLLMANTDVYNCIKEIEELYPNQVESYVMNFTHDVVDSYGNEREDVVYRVILNRQELNKVNWDGIEPSMLAELGDVTKYPVLNTIK